MDTLKCVLLLIIVIIIIIIVVVVLKRRGGMLRIKPGSKKGLTLTIEKMVQTPTKQRDAIRFHFVRRG